MRLTMLAAVAALAYIPFSAVQGCGGDDDDTPGVGEENESNDEPDEANDLALGDQVIGYVSSGDVDYFRLEIPWQFDGHKITVSLEDFDGRCFTGVDPNLEIFSSGEESLYWQEDSFENYCPSVSFAVLPEEVYYVKVGTSYDLSGDYTLSAVEGGPGTISGTVIEQGTQGADARRTEYGKVRETGQRKAQEIGQKKARGARRGENASSAEGRALMAVKEGELLIRPAPGLNPLELPPRLERFLGREARWKRPVMGGRYQLLELSLPEGSSDELRRLTLDLVEQAREIPGVLWAEPNRIYKPDLTPDDPDLGEQWALIGPEGINATEGWAKHNGSAETIIAVIDTGHDPDHPDLVNHAVPGYDFITDSDNANDQDDGPDDDPDDSTRNGHGTHTAGIAAADTDNGIGVAGVGWNLRYMPLRVCGNYGCTEADVVEAIWYAAGYASLDFESREEPRARTINLSLGGDDYCSVPLQDAIWAAATRGVIVAAAAGNQGEDATRHSPGNCEKVVTVGATDTNGVRADFSNHGAAIDVMAPGVDILSTYYGNMYAELSGTSMATPHVAGLAGLIKDVNPSFGFDTVLDLLTSHARPVDCGGANGGCGAGLIDAEASLDDALMRPNDPPEDLILAQAIDVDDSSHLFQTVVQDGYFLLDGLDAGTYQLVAGVDGDGDFLLGEEGELFDSLDELIEISEDGEDVGLTSPMILQ